MATRYLINGRPTIEFNAGDRQRLHLTPELASAEGVVIAPDQSRRNFVTRMRVGFAVVWVMVVACGFGLVNIGSPMDRARFTPLLVGLLIVVTAVMPFAYLRNLRNFRERTERLPLPAPPGSVIRVDASGLAIAGRAPLPWSMLAADTIEFIHAPGGRHSPSYYILRSLSLTAPGVSVTLDTNALTNGNEIVSNAYRRLGLGD